MYCRTRMILIYLEVGQDEGAYVQQYSMCAAWTVPMRWYGHIFVTAATYYEYERIALPGGINIQW